jgi:uncharacterized protein DUF4431
MKCLLTSYVAWLLLVASTCTAQIVSQTNCLPYAPALVELRGTLIRQTYPGTREDKGIPQGDKPETAWLLKLPQPVCVDVDAKDPDLNPAQPAIQRIQLVFDKVKEPRGSNAGKPVKVQGSLFGGHTGHHHTLVLLNVTALGKAD